MLLASASTTIFSSTTSRTPIRPSNSIVVVMSCRCGTLPIRSDLSVSSDATSTGNAAFLAPEIRISPRSGLPPDTINLSIDYPQYENIGQHDKAALRGQPGFLVGGLTKKSVLRTGDQLLQIATLIHRGYDIATADKLPIDIQLWDRWPL